MNKILLLLALFLTYSCASNKTTITENDKIGTGRLKNNLKSGKWTFSKDGKITSKGKYNKGLKYGNWKYYYENGKLHQEGDYVYDKQIGIWKYYFDTGQFMGTGKILHNQQIGLWEWYHKNGQLYTERYYNDGKLVEILSCYNKKGKILDCGKIENGNGKMKLHDTENETAKIEIFEFENGFLKK